MKLTIILKYLHYKCLYINRLLNEFFLEIYNCLFVCLSICQKTFIYKNHTFQIFVCMFRGSTRYLDPSGQVVKLTHDDRLFIQVDRQVKSILLLDTVLNSITDMLL